MSSPSAGGAFQPSADYAPTGDWSFAGDVSVAGDLTVTGTIINTGSALASPTITGTVAGGATYTAPILTTPTLGVASATTVNKVTITAPATAATLTLIEGTTVTGPPATGTLATLAGSETLTNKTIASSSTVPYAAGVASGYKVARGDTALDGSNPTPIATGLATIVSAVACVKRTDAVSSGTAFVTVDFTGSDGTLNVYGWVLAGSASTGTEQVTWIAIGT